MDIVKKLQALTLPMMNTSNYSDVMEVIFECGNKVSDLEKQLQTATAYKDVENKLTFMCDNMKDTHTLENELRQKEATIQAMKFELDFMKTEIVRLREANAILYKK